MTVATVLHSAEAAKSIYKNNDFQGYTLLGGFFDPKNDDRLGWKKDGDAGGASGGVYKYNNAKSQYILSFRGTKGDKDIFVDDVQIALNFTVDRASDCIRYANQVKAQFKDAAILVVGHSLGGFLAQVVGVECDLPFITYNAPPAGRALAGSRAAAKFKRGVNLRINWDPVSRAPGNHIGPVVTLPHIGVNILNAHKGESCLKSVNQASFRDVSAYAFITRQNM